jgi:signal transduction histidine kinase
MSASPLLIGGVGLAGVLVGGVLVARAFAGRVRDVERAKGWSEAQAEDQRRQLEETRHVQDLIFGSMREGVLLLDGGWRAVFSNDALERHLGSRPAALAQLHPPALRELVRRAAEARSPDASEVELGSPARWLRVNVTPAGDDGSVLLVVADVTEAKRIDEIRRDFVANASHELKTPSASIQAAAETLVSAAANDPGAVPRFAEQLHRDAYRLSRIVSDLLDLSRLESGSDLQDDIHLDAVAREEAQRFDDLVERTGLSLSLEAERVPPVRGSARDLSLLVRNLIDNAVRYTRGGGRVDVAVASANGDVMLRVSDTGLGIPSRDLSRVFERFYRVDPARSRDTGGTGLGLAIVKHVAENHGGEVSIESELGRGTTVQVRLPACPPTEPAPGRATS